MPSLGITSVAITAPMLASNAIFSTRRVSRGVDSIEENPLFAMANFDIAAGQILKGGRAAKAITLTLDESGATKEIFDKYCKTNSKTLKGFKKIANFTANNINPIIVGGGVLKVLGDKDPVDEMGRESTRLACMFGAEALSKELIGMPKVDKVTKETVSRTGFIEKLLSEKTLNAIEDSKALKGVLGGTKGLLFVLSSIAGYKLGDILSTKILGEKKDRE